MHKIAGVFAMFTPTGCAETMFNPLPVNGLGQGWRNVSPVLKGVKQFLCNGFAT
jgi:hypothetical protein